MVEKFFEEFDELCKKYNVSLAHEDTYGAFIVQSYLESNMKWVKDEIIQTHVTEGYIDEVKRMREIYHSLKSQLRIVLGNKNHLVSLKEKSIYTYVGRHREIVRPATEEELKLAKDIEDIEKLDIRRDFYRY